MTKWKCPKCGREFSRMEQQHYCEKPKTVDEYIAVQEESVRPLLEQIRSAIRSAIPDAEERISWSMPTYWKKKNIIHFAAAKKHIGLYPGSEAVEAFKDRLEGYKTSKGVVQLPMDRPMPLELIADIARWGYRNVTGEEPGGEQESVDKLPESGGKLYRLIGKDGKEFLSPEKGSLGGNRSTKIYGRMDCPVALRALNGPNKASYVGNRVFFKDEETAIAAGFRPCYACMRDRYKLWKAGIL